MSPDCKLMCHARCMSIQTQRDQNYVSGPWCLVPKHPTRMCAVTIAFCIFMTMGAPMVRVRVNVSVLQFAPVAAQMNMNPHLFEHPFFVSITEQSFSTTANDSSPALRAHCCAQADLRDAQQTSHRRGLCLAAQREESQEGKHLFKVESTVK